MTNRKIYHFTERKDGFLWDCLADEKTAECRMLKAEENDIFDFYVRQSFLDGNPYISGTILTDSQKNDPETFGHWIEDKKRFYDRYFSKNMRLEEILSERIKERYEPTVQKKNTSGHEFSTGKFYSVASSSRLTVSSFTKMNDRNQLDYIDSIKIEGKQCKIVQNKIEFEHDTRIHGIPRSRKCPQLDVYFKTEDGRTVFIEVKNHEILGNHQSVELSPSYMKTDSFKEFNLPMNLISKTKRNRKGENTKDKFISIEGNDEVNRFLLAFDFGCELVTFHFDFTQFIRHLMGILSYAEDNPDEKIYFYYLIYRNDLFEKENGSKLYEELEAEVKNIFNVFGRKFPEIHFGLCYNNGYDTLIELKDEAGRLE